MCRRARTKTLSPGDCFRCVRPLSGEREPAMRCCGSVQRHIGPRGPVPICAYVQCLRQSRASLTHTEHVHVRLWLFACVCVRFMVNNRFARVSALILCVVVGASDAHTRKRIVIIVDNDAAYTAHGWRCEVGQDDCLFAWTKQMPKSNVCV